MTKKHAPWYFICNLYFKSQNFQTESPFKRVSPTSRGSTTHSFFCPCYALRLGQGFLNDFVKYLLMLNCSPKAVPMTKKRNISCSKADLSAIVLVSIQMKWQNQYNLSHLMVPEWTRSLLPNLEAIKWVMVQKQNERLKAISKASTDCPDTKSDPKRRESGGLGDQVPGKVCSEKICQHCKAHGGPDQTHNTSDYCC